MKLITKEIAPRLIAAYEHSAETGEGGKVVLAKYFTPWGNATWFITEGMPVDGNGEPLNGWHEAIEPDSVDWHLFGYCYLGDVINAELGYVMLSDLKGLKGPFGLKVERDLYYGEHTLAEVMAEYSKRRAA